MRLIVGLRFRVMEEDSLLLNKRADRRLALILSKYYSSTHLENCLIDVGFKTLELVHRC
jgi:hypothetical protein